MNNSYWTKKDYRKHNEIRRAAEMRDKRLELIDVDCAGGTPGATPVEPVTLPKVYTDIVRRKVDMVARKPLDRVCEEPPSQGLNPGEQSQGCGPTPLYHSRLVRGPKHKEQILANYQDQFGAGKPITTNVQGKPPAETLQPPSQYQLMKSCRMKPDKKKSYGLDHPIFENILVIILGKYLKGAEISRLARVNRFFGKIYYFSCPKF